MKDIPAVEGGQPIRPKDRGIVFGSPMIGKAEADAVADCISRRWIGTGPKVVEFEAAFAAYKGAPHAVAVSSCSAAIHLALLAFGVGSGDEVISPTLTYCAALHDIVHVGATPVLVDSDPQTLNLKTDLEKVVTPRTKAIIVLHFAGRSCEMDEIMQFARERGIYVIEDCAHAIETKFRGESAGLIGDAGCFSFYPTKNMTTIEGGMVITRDAEVARRVRTLSQQGLSQDAWARYSDQGYRHYEIVEAGFKYNMTDIQAAIGLVQLKSLQENYEQRSRLWAYYEEELQVLPLVGPATVSIEGDDVHALHLYTVQLELENLSIDRDRFLAALAAENIGVGVHYVPIHLSLYYRQRYHWIKGDFPCAESAGERLISLPLGADLDVRDVEDVCRALARICHFFSK